MTPRQLHIEQLSKITVKYASRFFAILKKDYKKVAKYIEETGDVRGWQISGGKYAYNLYKLYLTVGIDKAIEEHNKLVRTKSAGQDMVIYEWLTFLQGYADRTLAERVTKIPETTRNELSKIIEQGLTDGKGYKDIAKDIRQQSDGDFNRYRSLLIARTEGNNAVNAGAYIAARASGLVMDKSWLHAGHAKRENRPVHVRLAQQTVDAPIGLNDYFNVEGKQMLFPGDPAGGAEQNCNCRCVALYKPRRDANDNAIAINRRSYELTAIQRAARTSIIEGLLATLFAGVLDLTED